jgi:signal peptidase I
MRKTTGWALGIFAWAAASIATLLLALSFVPTLFGFETLIVASGSMGRTLPIGSVALTRAVEAGAVSVGDVVSFRHRGQEETITHRVVGVARQNSQYSFTTKGDANREPDVDNVIVGGSRIHRVEFVVPVAGHLVRYARTPLGGVALIFVPIVGLLTDRRGRQRDFRTAGKPSRKRPHAVPYAGDVGWSTTTYHLVRVSPHVLRGDPGG